MVQKKTIKRKTRKSTPKKSSSKRKTMVERYNSKEMAPWLRNLLVIGFICCISFLFYFFAIRPYSYRWKPCYGLKAYGICVPCCFDIHGIDVSHHQGYIDWNSLKQTRTTEFPIDFAFIKATEGGDYADSTFVRNFREARNQGFIRGAYHFYIPSTSAEKQAEFFIKMVKLQKGDLPPVLDVELKGHRKDSLTQGVKIWLKKIEAHYGVKPILYTSYKFKKRYLKDRFFDQYPYWIAHYYVDSVQYEGSWHFWQHSDVGTVPGISKQVDLNVFNGTMEELQKLLIP